MHARNYAEGRFAGRRDTRSLGRPSAYRHGIERTEPFTEAASGQGRAREIGAGADVESGGGEDILLCTCRRRWVSSIAMMEMATPSAQRSAGR